MIGVMELDILVLQKKVVLKMHIGHKFNTEFLLAQHVMVVGRSDLILQS